jgi:DnaJ like chaperone protein
MMADIDAPSSFLKDEHPGFLLSLMIISSYVIQADGKIMHSELEYLRGFLLENYGPEKKEKYVELLLKLFEESKKYSHDDWILRIKECANELNDYTTEEQRMLLMSFLIKIVKADKKVEYTEVQSLRNIAEWLRVDLMLSEKINNLQAEQIWRM